MAGAYPWYETINDDSLSQGDLLPDCPILTPPLPVLTHPTEAVEGEREVSYSLYNVVVMSQSCDLAYEKLDLVLVCPYFTIADFQGVRSGPLDSGQLERIRQGREVGYHMLNRCEIQGFHESILIVDFRNTYSVPLPSLKQFVRNRAPRLRLCPPYRERLSQAFARFFMRVGLPVDIDPFQ